MNALGEDYRIGLTSPPYWYHCERWWRWQPPPLSDFDLWYVGGGSGKLRFDGETWDMAKNSCFVLAPEMRLLGTQNPDERLIIFAAHFQWLDHRQRIAAPPFVFPREPLEVRDPSHFEDMARRAEQTFARGDALGRVQSTAWVRQMILHLIAECVLSPPTPLDAAIEEIIARLRQAPVPLPSVQELAARLRLSPSQFTRRFRAATGLAPHRFLIRTRLEHARQLLRETDMTQEHIAQVLGYTDAFFFSRQYKQWMGETPGATRRKAHAP